MKWVEENFYSTFSWEKGEKKYIKKVVW